MKKTAFNRHCRGNLKQEEAISWTGTEPGKQDKIFPNFGKENTMCSTWTSSRSGLSDEGTRRRDELVIRWSHLDWVSGMVSWAQPRIPSFFPNRPLIQVRTQPQPCLAYEIWQDHSLREEVCNTLWQWLTWLLIEMGRNVETLCIRTHKISQLSSQAPQSLSVAAGVETYELIWKMHPFLLMEATTLRSFNYIMSCHVPVWNDTEEHVVTWDNSDELHPEEKPALKGIWCGKAGSSYVCGSHGWFFHYKSQIFNGKIMWEAREAFCQISFLLMKCNNYFILKIIKIIIIK